jgi:hypothetical protein
LRLVYDWQNHLVQTASSAGTVQFRSDGDGQLVGEVAPDGSGTDHVGRIYDKALATGQETERYYLGDWQVAQDQAGALHSVASASYLESGGDLYTYQEYGPDGSRRWPFGTSGLLPSPDQFRGQCSWTSFASRPGSSGSSRWTGDCSLGGNPDRDGLGTGALFRHRAAEVAQGGEVAGDAVTGHHHRLHQGGPLGDDPGQRRHRQGVAALLGRLQDDGVSAFGHAVPFTEARAAHQSR